MVNLNYQKEARFMEHKGDIEVDLSKALQIFELNRDRLLSYEDNLLNETDTRRKIIDFLFEEILLYDKDCIQREEHYKSGGEEGYIDYIFETDRNFFLIEAKRNGYYFNIPNRIKKASSKGILSNDENTKRALEQARKYCINKNISVGCISNGVQLIVFLCHSLEKKYDAYIFNGYDDIMKDFIKFNNIFGPYSNAELALNNILDNGNNNIREVPQFQKKILSALYDADKQLNRNPIYSHIEPVMDLFFSDLTSSKSIKYLNECYYTQENTEKNDTRLKDIFMDRIPHINLPVQDASNLIRDFENKRNILKKEPLISKEEVLLVVGGVGAGKTTFLYRFFNYILPEESKKNLVWIHIDFIEESSEDINVKEYIYKECLKQLREEYSNLEIDKYEMLTQIYGAEINRLKEGALKTVYLNNRSMFDSKISDLLYEKVKNEIQFTEDVLRFYSTDPIFYKNICITLDNADQKSEKFQVNCITAAYDIAKRINCIMLLSMRESSYWKLKNVEPLDAYRGNAYHVSAPSISSALGKRIDVASKEFNKEEILIESNGKRYVIKIKDFLLMLKNSIFIENGATEKLFDYMSANNLRFAMEMLKTFLISGHTNTEEYIKTYFTTGDYIIPYHAFIRSIALGDFKYYHSDKSIFINIIEKDYDGFYSHFTRARILKYLDDRITISSYAGKGLLEVNSIFNEFRCICNNIDNFKQIINTLLSKRLIITENGFVNDCYDSKYIAISSTGHYYLTEMIYEFSYLERLCEDTSINSQIYFEKIKEYTFNIEKTSRGRKQMELRVERLEVFLDYLKKEEEEEKIYISNSSINYLFVEDIIKNFNEERRNILR